MRPQGLIVYRGPSKINGKPIVAIATNLSRASKNTKTGAMIQVYILADEGHTPVEAALSGTDKAVCGNCPHRPKDGKLGSCYVNLGQGPLNVWKAYQAGKYPRMNIRKHLRLFKGKAIRMGAYGDPAALPLGLLNLLHGVADTWTSYTHQWKRAATAYARHCMASVESLELAAIAKQKGYRTFRTRLSAEPLGEAEFVCPASAEAGKKKDCAACGACNGAKSPKDSRHNPVIVVHGLQWKVERYQAAQGKLSLI